MKIIYDAPGQTCNRLWSYVALISKAITDNDKVVILRFDRMINNFSNLLNSKYVSFPLYNALMIKIIGIDKYLLIINRVFFNRFTHNWTLRYWSRRGEIVKGWDYRGIDLDLDKNKKQIKDIFTPDNFIVENIDNVFCELRKIYEVIVGVHIRRGDYKTWLNGKYFYELQEYCLFMNKYSNKTNKRMCFFICSDEKIDIDFFEGLNCYRLNQPSPIADLYALSCCDRIMGPLSTFSRWASFIGEVPLLALERDEYEIEDRFFSKVINLYKCENGTEFINWTYIVEQQNKYEDSYTDFTTDK